MKKLLPLIGLVSIGIIAIACSTSEDADGDGLSEDAGPTVDGRATEPDTGAPDAASDASSSGDADADAPVLVDGDGDGVDDSVDNCPLRRNPSQGDADNDGKGDACDDEIVDNATSLVIPLHQGYGLDGTRCYAEVYIDGSLLVKTVENGGTGKLTLKAPVVFVGPEGLIDANAAGPRGGQLNFNASHGGLGGAGTGRSCGGGPGSSVGQAASGGSYGGLGGRASESALAAKECPACNDFQGELESDFHCWGKIGATYGTADGADIEVGSGGGSAGNSSGCTGAGGVGGNGGGAVVIVGTAITIDGTVRANGETGPDPVLVSSCSDYRAGGGGGSGGGIVIAALGGLAGAATLSANGGDGGRGLGSANAESWAWSGGGGGGGRIKVYAPSFGGTLSATSGLAGDVPAPPDGSNHNLIGTHGSDGTTSTSSTVPTEWSSLSCSP